MFTGLIEETGTVLWIRATDRGTQLQIAAPASAASTRTGGSLAVNGCCLTITSRRGEQLAFDLLEETLARTNLKNLRRDTVVNLERPVRAGAAMEGHFVQGHVDCAARVISYAETGGDHRLEIELAPEFARYIAHKGSIAVNGISLTVAEISRKSFVVWIIPHTRHATNLASVQPGDLVNLEFDILAKYVERVLQHRSAQKTD